MGGSLWAVSSSQGRMWKRIATDFPAGIFHASSFRVASAPFQKHMYSHTGHRETRNLKGFASSWWVKVSYFLHESSHIVGIVLEGFFCLHDVTFLKTLMADYEHFLRWVTCFNWFLWSIMPSGDVNTKFWTRHLRFSTRKLPLNMDYFEVFNHFFIFCISFSML